jgi:hypothetical protein
MTKPKQIKIPENITINFPADALSVIENGENAYIYANGVTYRVIENKRYWNEIEEIKAQALPTQLEEIIAVVEDWGKMLKSGSNEWLIDDLVEKLNQLKQKWRIDMSQNKEKQIKQIGNAHYRSEIKVPKFMEEEAKKIIKNSIKEL